MAYFFLLPPILVLVALIPAGIFLRSSLSWRRFELGLAVAWLTWAAWVSSNVVPDMFWWIGLLWSGLLIAVAWTVHLVVDGVGWSVRRRLPGLRTLLIAAATPAVGAVGAALLCTPFTFQARLALSEESIEAHARRALAEGKASPGRMGLFWASEARVEGQCVYFITADDFIDDAGLAWCAEGEPSAHRSSFDHVRGHIWTWHRRF